MNIALLSRGVQLYSTQSILEAAKGRGHKVKIIDHMRCNLVLINKRPGIIYEGEMLHEIDAIIPRIGASITHEGASVIRQFEAMGICTLTRSNALLKTRNKLRSFQNLIARNIPVPDT
ncbi:MAG: 30S ribosomal protein S6--L-glutamate ligase, partial [Saprospiraceae bacterium]